MLQNVLVEITVNNWTNGICHIKSWCIVV